MFEYYISYYFKSTNLKDLQDIKPFISHCVIYVKEESMKLAVETFYEEISSWLEDEYLLEHFSDEDVSILNIIRLN